MPEITIVIVNWNTRDLLKSCLETFYNPRFQIIIVDNASVDGSVEMLNNEFPDVEVIKNSKNLGFSTANNQAIQQSAGEICVLLNPDTLVIDHAFDELKKSFKKNSKAGIVGPMVLNRNGSIQPSFGCFPSVWTEFIFQFFLYKFFPSPFPYGQKIHPLTKFLYKKEQSVDWISGACLAIRKDVIEEIGLLDENIFMYGEDVEWCWRAKQAGYEVRYEPGAKIIHYQGHSSHKDYASWIERYTLGQLRLLNTIKPTSTLRVAGLTICAGSLLRILIWGMIEKLVPSKAIEAKQRIHGYQKAYRLGEKAVRGR